MTTGKMETTHNLSRALVSQGKDDVQKIEISLDVCATDITQIVFQSPLLKVKKVFLHQRKARVSRPAGI